MEWIDSQWMHSFLSGIWMYDALTVNMKYEMAVKCGNNVKRYIEFKSEILLKMFLESRNIKMMINI